MRDQAAALHFAARFEQKLSAMITVPGLPAGRVGPRWRRRAERLAMAGRQSAGGVVVRSAGFRVDVERGEAPINISLFVLAPRSTTMGRDVEAVQSAGVLTLADLIVWAEAAIARAERGEERWVIGLSSVSGWSADAVAMVAGDGRIGGWAHPRVTLVLVDLEASVAHANTGDPIAKAWRSVFAPPLPSEAIGEVVEHVKSMIQGGGRDHLSLQDLVATGIGEPIGLAALRALAGTPGWQLDDVPGVGSVIIRTAHG